MDKNAASISPKPTTDATARFGKMSDTTVYIVADQPWCAAPARPKKAAACHGLLTYGVKITGNVQHAQMNEAVFRARFTDQPRFRKYALKLPPPMLPSAAAVATNASGKPKCFRSRWNCLLKKSGSQKP